MKRYDLDGYDAGMLEYEGGDYVYYEDAARILAQRDKLAELLDKAYQHCSVNGHCELGGEWFDFVKKELAELDKEKQS